MIIGSSEMFKFLYECENELIWRKVDYNIFFYPIDWLFKYGYFYIKEWVQLKVDEDFDVKFSYF